MSLYKIVVKSNMLRLMCFLLTLNVDVTFGDPVYQPVVGKVLDHTTFVSEISVVLDWCKVATVKDVWNPSSFVTSKCNRKVPPFDNSTVLTSSVDFDFDSLLCTSLYDASIGACYLAQTNNHVNISVPDRPVPVAEKFCNDTKIVLSRNASYFLNLTRLWVEAFNENIQDELKCTKECIAGEKINPLCKAVVKLNTLILLLYNEVPHIRQNPTGNIPQGLPAPPMKSGNLRTPSLDKISLGNSRLTEILAGANTQLQNVNTSNKLLPVNVSSSSSLSKDNKGLRGSTVQNDTEQASRQLNGASQELHGNVDLQTGKVSESTKTEKGNPKQPLSSDKKIATLSRNNILTNSSGTHDKPAENSNPNKLEGKTVAPGLTSIIDGASGSNFQPSAPSVQFSEGNNNFHSLNNNTQPDVKLSSDKNNKSNNDGLQSGTLPVNTGIGLKQFQLQNTGHETQPTKLPGYGRWSKPLQPSDTGNVLGNNLHPVMNREMEQIYNQKKIVGDKTEIDQEVLPPTTVSTKTVDKAQKMDSSIATGISNPTTVNSQFQDTAQGDSTDETYPGPDSVSDIHTLDEDDDVEDGLETVPDGEVPPVVGENVLVSKQHADSRVPPVDSENMLVSKQQAVSRASFPIQDTVEEDNVEFVKTEDSHFFAYFMTMIVLCIIGYLVFHNKQKILALALEGRSRRGTRRRPNTAGYRKLDSNLEEAVTSQCSSASVTHVIY